MTSNTRPPEYSDWDIWLSETMLADKLVFDSLHEVARVTRGLNPIMGSQKYLAEHRLFNALVSYTSGLERFCKLTLLANRLKENGALSNIRAHGHELRGLLSAIGVEPAQLPEPRATEQLFALLTDFAKGRRYELLDALQPQTTPSTPSIFARWWAISDQYPLRPECKQATETMSLAHQALWHYLNSTETWPETIIWPLSESLDYPYDPAAVQMGWLLYDIVSLVISKFDDVSTTLFYSHPISGFPYLPEAHRSLGSSGGTLPSWALFQHEDDQALFEESLQFLGLDDPEEYEDDNDMEIDE